MANVKIGSGALSGNNEKKRTVVKIGSGTLSRTVDAEKYQRQQMEDELAQLRQSYDAGRTVEMQGIADNRSWEEIYAENDRREETRRRIGYLENQLNRMKSDDYYKGVQERMAALDTETVDALDRLRKGMPTETVNMQGIADNRSWEEIYAEREAYDNAVRQLLREKGYDDSQIAQMADDRQRQVNRETYEAEVAKSQQEAEAYPFWASVKSVPQNLTGGLGTLNLAGQNAHKALTGDDRPVDYYTPEMVGQAKAQAARETVSEDMGKVGSFLYNTGMSMADSAAVALIGGVAGGAAASGAAGVAGASANAAQFGAKVGGALLGGTAATQAAREAKERGVSDAQALLTGLAAGTAEMFFEKYSLGNLLGMKPARGVLTERILGNLKNIGVQGMTEGSEELFTSVANAMADAIINGDKNAYTASIYDYMAQGLSYEEATQKATADFAASLARDFLGGMLSGGVLGGMNSVPQTALETAAIGRKQKGQEQALIDRRLEQKAGDQAAIRMKENMAKGIMPGNIERRELFERILRTERQQAEKQTVEAATKRLRELGEEGDAEKIARAAVRSAAGKEGGVQAILGGERALRDSKYGVQVVQELQEKADWTQGIKAPITRRQLESELEEATVNPKAKDQREVTGSSYNPKTGKMEALVQGEDGETAQIPMEDAAATGKQMKLAQYAAAYEADGATMMAAIRPKQDVETYARQWEIAYSYGAGGAKVELALKSPGTSDLLEEQRRLAWEAGRKAYEKKTAQNAKERARRAREPGVPGTVSLRGATIDGVKYNAVPRSGLTKKQKDSIQYMRVLARETGVNVVFYESTVREDGTRMGANGVYKDGTIYLDIAAGADTVDVAQAAILRTAGHELTHFIQDMDEEAYGTIRDFVLDKLQEAEGVDLETLINRQMAKNKELTRDEAMDEVIADACEMMLKDSTVLEELARQDMSLAEKIVNFLRDLMRRLQKAFEGVDAKSAEAKTIAEYTKELQEIWDKALRSAIDGSSATKNTAETGGGKYQIREEFASEMDAWDKAGRPEGEQFILGSTGPVLQGLGAIESDIYVTGDKIKAILQNHPEMTLDEIKKVPQILEDPVMVLKSRNVGRDKRANTRMVVFGSVKAKNGSPVFAVLDLRPVENGFAVEGMQKVNSAYTKSTEPVQFIRESYVLHADKKRTVPLLRSIGFQMPIELLRDGSVGSISYRQRSVNLYGIPFSSVVNEKTGKMSARGVVTTAAFKEWFGDWENDPENASKVVNENGTPKIVYHGTGEEFTVFGYDKVGSATGVGILGDGFYFADKKRLAKGYGENVMSVYLDMKRPYMASANDAYKLKTVELEKQGYDGVILKAPAGDVYMVFNNTQIKSATDNVGAFDRNTPDIRYSLRDSEITDREILAATLDSAAQTETERNLLERYRKHATELAKQERELAHQRSLVRKGESGEKVGDRRLSSTELTQARNRAAIAAQKVDRENKFLRGLENREALQAVLAREKTYIEEVLNGDMEAHRARYEPSLERKLAEEWSKAQYWKRRYDEAVGYNPRERRATERARKAELRKRIEKSAKQLADLLIVNTDKKHVPEDLKVPLGEFLKTLDLSSTRLLSGGPATAKDRDYANRLVLVKEALDKRVKAVTGGETIAGYLDLPTGFADRVQDHIEEARKVMERLPGPVVNNLSVEQMEELQMILTVLRKSIDTVNELMANRRFKKVDEAAKADMAHLRELGRGGGDEETAVGKAEGFLSWTQMLPVYAFRKLGKGAQSIFESMQDGWDKLARNAKMVIDFTEETYTPAEAKAWSEELHETTLYNPDTSEHEKMYLTTAQIMSLWGLRERPQAFGHIVGDPDHPGMGIRPEDIVLPKSLKHPAGKVIRQGTRYRMTEGDIYRITDMLTDRQLEVAKKIQEFMERQGSAWGNAVSMERHGYNFFGEAHYFPIETDRQNQTEKGTEQGSENDMYRLLHLSSTKSLTKYARNAVMVRNIFDVYSNHMADMAKYNALALPLLDAIKWYNWSQNPEGVGSAIEGAGDTTLKRQITETYGKAANDYIVQFIRDMNGVKEGGGRGEDLPKRMISNYKRASVAANLRVAFLQPTSYVRAGAVIDPKYLVRAAREKTTIKAAAEEMKQHSGIALWKSLGFFDTDVGRSMREQIRGTQSKMDKLIDKSMKPAEKGDEITWAMLWKACKLEQRAKGLAGDALIQATSERFREVVYATQVVDSTMTRSGLMRSTTTFNKMATSFMSEPTVSYNMVMEAVDQVRADMRKGKGMNARMAIKKNAKLIRTVFITYASSAAVSAIVEAFFDALRDDDDEPYLDRVLESLAGWDGNLVGNLNPLSKIPYVKDAVSLIEGYDTGRMDTQGIATAWKSVQQLWETFAVWSGVQEKPTKVTNYGNTTPYGLIYQAFKGVSQLSGIPLSNVLREGQTVWNTWNALMQSAGWDGLKVKTYENESETRSRNLYEAMVDGDRATWEKESAKWQKQLVKDGAAEREAVSTVRSGVKSKLRDDYYAKTVPAAQAEKYLTGWLGMKKDEAEAQRLEWDCFVETGIKYSDIRTLYERDEIERSEVISLRMKYGQETRDEANAKAKWYDWGKDHPRYSDLSEKKAGGWYDYVKSSGLSAERYYNIAMEAAEQGVNSKEELVAFIRKQGVSNAQQRALWNALKNSNWKNTGTPWA